VNDGHDKYVDWPTRSLKGATAEVTTGNETFVLVEGLRAGVAYKAKVAVQREGSWSSYSAYSASIKLPTPAKPMAPSLHSVNASTLRVSWPAVAGADFYSVIVNDGHDKYVDWPTKSLKGEKTEVTTGNETFVLVEGLKAEVAYRAKVAARTWGAWSEYSDLGGPIILPLPAAPQAPSIEAIDHSTLRVSWSAVPGADKYAVLVNDGKAKFVDSCTESLRDEAKDATSGSATSVLVKGVRPDVSYTAKVAALHGTTWSAYSSSSAAFTVLPTPDPPLVEVVNNSMLVVSWPPVPGADKYDVIVHDGEVNYVNWQANSLQKSATDTGAGSSTSVLVKGLQANVSYKAKVAASHGGFWGDYSAYGSAVKLGTRPREQECTVCMNRQAEVALDPCGHLCVCQQCAGSVAHCPVCRGSIHKRLRVYGC